MAKRKGSDSLRVLPPFGQAPEFSQRQWKEGHAIWWGDYTTPFFEKQPPSSSDLRRASVCQTAAGESEPLVLGIWGLRDAGMVTLEVEECEFPIDIMASEFQERVVPKAPTQGRRRMGIPYWLPRQATTRIEAGKNTVYWLTVRVPQGTPAGVYEGKLSLLLHERGRVDSHYERHELPRVLLPFSITVLPISLPPAQIAYGMYFRPRTLDERYQEKALMRQYYRDMAAHDHTSATVYAPDSICDDFGELRLEGKRTTEIIEEMLADGLIHPEIPVMLLGGIGRLDEPAAKKFTALLQTECRRRGWPELLIYAPDEPASTGERGPGCIDEFNRLQRFRPGCRLVTAISFESARYFSKQLDVWVVHNGGIDQELKALVGEVGAEMWTYDCCHRGTNPTFNRFYPGLYTWALGLKGNFLWCYTDYEPIGWEKERCTPFNYVLPSDTGPVSSVGWETRREGIKDYRYLCALEKLLSEQSGSRAAEEARVWLEKLASRVRWNTDADRPEPSERWDERDLYSQCPEIAAAEFSQIRAKLIELILSLSK